MRKRYSFEDCKKDAKNYIYRSEWKKKSRNIYQAAVRNKWLDKCCSHMKVIKKSNGYWNLIKCKKDALNYNSRLEWQHKSKAAYSRACKNKWLDECCNHMIKLGSRHKRLIYAFEFPDKSVYIGLTYNLELRKNNHLLHTKKRIKSTVFQYIEKTGLYPKFIELSDYLDRDIASIKEGEFLKQYKQEDWNILNKTKTGGLGGGIRFWTKEKCIDNALKYKSKSEWYKKSAGAYDAALKNKWIDECSFHMKRPVVWNKKTS